MYRASEKQMLVVQIYRILNSANAEHLWRGYGAERARLERDSAVVGTQPDGAEQSAASFMVI